MIATETTDPSLAFQHRWGNAAEVLYRLRQQVTNEAQRAQLREWAGKLSAQCQPGDDVQYNLALAVGDWVWAQRLVEAGKPGLLAFQCAGKMALQQHGRKAAARRYGEIFDAWKIDGDCREAVMAASAMRILGEADRARRYYENAMKCRTRQKFELCAKIDLADLEREQGNSVRATDLLKEVMADPDAKIADYSRLEADFIDPLGCGTSWSGNGFKLYEKAAQILQQLRGGTPEAAKR